MLSKPIAKLVHLQIERKLTDKEMAGRLGCSRQLWQMTRTEKIPLSNTMIKCISQNFPELHQDIIKFLSQSGDKLSKNVAKNLPKQPSEAQGGGLKRFFVGLLERLRK